MRGMIPILEGKKAWLNIPFFFIRMVIYFTGWIALDMADEKEFRHAGFVFRHKVSQQEKNICRSVPCFFRDYCFNKQLGLDNVN